MMIDLSTPEVAFAVEAVRTAGQLARAVQAELVEPALMKADRSPVTVADFAAQALVGCLFERAFSGVPLVAEEDAHALRASEAEATLNTVTKFVRRFLIEATPQAVCDWIDRGNGQPDDRFWALDPVDGTKGFLRREQYAVALAYLVEGSVQVGALACPNLTDAQSPEPGGPGSLIVAVRGHGAWVSPLDGGDFRRLRVSQRDDPGQARLLRSVESGHTNVGRIGTLIETLRVEAEPVLMDSQAKYAVLAAGRGDLLFRLLSSKQPDYRERIWDQAAGSLVVEEAGGRITDLFGKPLDFTAGKTLANNRGVMASNGHLHEAALAALREAL